MGRAAAAFDRGVTRVQGKMTQLGSKLQATGAKLANLQTGLAALGAGAALKSSMEKALEFERAMNLTAAVTGAQGEQFEFLKQKAMEWGASTQFSAVQTADAMAELGKKGLSANQILDMMPGTMALAAAGQLSLAQAAEYSTQVVNQFGLGLSDTQMVADLMAVAAANSATSVEGIAAAMGNAGIQAKMAGLSVQDTTTLLMAMAQKGLEGAEGGTMLMNALRSLTVMTPKVRKGFEGMGINIDQFRDATTGSMTDMFGLIDAMRDAGATPAALGEMFDVRALKGVSVLLETTEEEMDALMQTVSNFDGASQAMSDTLMQGNVRAITEFKSAMEGLQISVGGFAADFLKPLIEKFTGFIQMLQTKHPGVLKFITMMMIGLTALGAVLVPLGLIISAVGTLLTVLGPLMFGLKVWTGIQMALNGAMAANPIGLIIVGIAALGVAVFLTIRHWERFKEMVQKTWDTFKGFAMLLGGPFSLAIKAVVFMVETIRSLIRAWGDIKTAFKDEGFIAGILEIGRAILNGVLGPVQSLLDLLSKIPGRFGDAAASMSQRISEQRGALPGGAFQGEQQAPLLERLGVRKNAEATATAEVQVVTEEGMNVQPFTRRGASGRNMGNPYNVYAAAQG